MASISEPFIRRPVGTTLLAIGLFLVGGVAYQFLPVAAVPNVDFPSIRVSATRPGADPSVMAATVAAPLERRLGEIAGIDQITSTSSLGTTSIQLQFAIGRNIDKAARDVQAAINASLADLPSDLPTLPRFRKANPAAAPIPAPMPSPFTPWAIAPIPAPAAVVCATVPTSFPFPPPPVTLPSESMVSLPPESALRGAAFKLTV